MRRAYYVVRGISYACGIAAVLMVLSGWRPDIGYLLLLTMFVLFCVSYVMYALLRRGRQK